LTPPPIFTTHPDNGKSYVGIQIPNFAENIKEVIQAHEKLCPEVPLAGWDLALTKEVGPCLLEANLSCNFFKGSFDHKWYFEFIRDYFLFCEQAEAEMKRRRDSDPRVLVKKTQYGTVAQTALQKEAERGRQWKRRSMSWEPELSIG